MRLINTIFIVAPLVQAQAADQWMFKSPHDHFTLQQNKALYTLGNKEANMEVLNNFLVLFDTPKEGSCPEDLPQKPDASITRKIGKNSQTIEFFIDAAYARQGDNCIYVEGNGLHSLPLHRSWFIGPNRASIDLDDQLKIYKNQQKVFDFIKKDTGWENQMTDRFINWDYFQQVLDGFKDFPVHQRLHLKAIEGKDSFELQTGRNSYSFYRVKGNFWAVKMPKVQWLLVSDAWAMLEDFDEKKWLDRFNTQLLILTSTKKSLEERKGALSAIGINWSNAIKGAYHQILTSTEESNELKSIVLNKIKQKPTLENMKVLVKALGQTEDIALQSQISKILRLLNPKGPEIKEDQPGKVSEAISQWQSWAKSAK